MNLRKNSLPLVIGLLCGSGVSANDDIEEVVVTASKSGVQLENLAGAANVVGGDEVGPGGIENSRDLVAEIPNLSIGDQFGFARVFMRGIGMTSIDIGGEGAVSFLQDGAIIPRPSAQLMGMFDLEQIEVLRGPQGTLYGRGATAGAINMVTAKPGEEFGGYALLSAGNYDAVTFEGAVDVPFSDTFAMRLATKLERRDGFGENIATGNDIDDRDAEAFRATFSYRPDSNWGADLSIQHYEEDDNNFGFHYFGPSAGTPGPVPLGVLFLNGQTVQQVGGDFFDINSDQEAINERDALLVNLKIDADLSEKWSLTSITSVQELDRFLRDDLDSTDIDLFGQNNYVEESESFGQEFIFNYTGDRVNVVAGLMYFEEELFGQVQVPLTNICLVLAPATCGTPAGDALNAGQYLQDGDVDITAYGAFAEATVQLNDNWSVIGGLRYNYEERDGTGAFIFDAIALNVATDQKEDWNDVTPRLTIQYDNNENMMVYLTYNSAFKSGVINTGSLSAPLDPETVDAFEIGVKGNLGAWDYAITAFSYDYEDLQISFVDATSTVSTINAAEAENQGLELELSAAFDNGFSTDFFLTFLDTEYQEFVNGDYANGFAITDLSGNSLPNAPEQTAKLGLNYDTELRNGTLRFRIEGYYQDEVFFTEWNRDDAKQDSYTLLHANIDYMFSDDWRVSLWGRNLTDREVISNNIITAPLYQSLRVGSVLPPRTYGLSVEYNF